MYCIEDKVADSYEPTKLEFYLYNGHKSEDRLWDKDGKANMCRFKILVRIQSWDYYSRVCGVMVAH